MFVGVLSTTLSHRRKAIRLWQRTRLKLLLSLSVGGCGV
jgi:hypothetical protein